MSSLRVKIRVRVEVTANANVKMAFIINSQDAINFIKIELASRALNQVTDQGNIELLRVKVRIRVLSSKVTGVALLGSGLGLTFRLRLGRGLGFRVCS